MNPTTILGAILILVLLMEYFIFFKNDCSYRT